MYKICNELGNLACIIKKLRGGKRRISTKENVLKGIFIYNNPTELIAIKNTANIL